MSWRQRRILPLSDTEEGPRDDHDPPLGFVFRKILPQEFDDHDRHLKDYCDCHYPLDGDGLVLCEEHKDD